MQKRHLTKRERTEGGIGGNKEGIGGGNKEESGQQNDENERILFTFLQGLGETVKEAMNCFRWAEVRIVLGRLGPLRPSLGRDPSSTMKSSPKGPFERGGVGQNGTCLGGRF